MVPPFRQDSDAYDREARNTMLSTHSRASMRAADNPRLSECFCVSVVQSTHLPCLCVSMKGQSRAGTAHQKVYAEIFLIIDSFKIYDSHNLRIFSEAATKATVTIEFREVVAPS